MLPSRKELKQRYALWSTKKLLFVLHHKHEYTSVAVEVARAELGKRNITSEEVDQFLNDLEHERNLEKMLANVSLTFLEKLRCFFFWFLPSRPTLKNRYHLKERQSRNYAIAGYISFFVTGFVIVHFRLSFLLMAGLLPPLFLLFYWCEKQMGKVDALR